MVPTMELKTKEETLTAVQTMKPKGWLYHRSDWVLSEYSEFMKIGEYPYLDRVHEFIKERHGISLEGETDRNLHGLVYQAAKEYRERRDIAEGWIQATDPALLEYEGKFVEVRLDSIIGTCLERRKVVRVGDRLVFMKPRCRRLWTWANDSLKFRPLTK